MMGSFFWGWLGDNVVLLWRQTGRHTSEDAPHDVKIEKSFHQNEKGTAHG